MNNSKVKQRISKILEVLFTALLFSTQTILNAGVAISIMTIPLLPYIAYLLTGRYPLSVLAEEIWVMTFASAFIVGRIIALIGITVLLIAAAQWIINHRKKVGLFKTGLYARVRHPQFTGIIITTMGLTIMVLTNGNFGKLPFVNLPLVEEGYPIGIIGLWFLQVLGYIAIAYYEERKIAKQFSEEYKEYKRKTPFLFPIKRPRRIPELIFTIIIVIVICIILWLLPYDLIGIYSRKLYTTPLMP
jgi:protein-S-isoprenylcysteine O-methyltransferase Ste14